MGFLRGAMKSAIAAKAVQIIAREAQKPENQRKAREMLAKARSRKR